MNHSKRKAWPVLQTDLHLEQEEGRALWFKSYRLGWTQLPNSVFCSLCKLRHLHLARHLNRSWQLYVKPNHQKLGKKWKQEIENQNNAGFVTKSRADWTNSRSIFNYLKTWSWNSVPNSRHNLEFYNVTWKNYVHQMRLGCMSAIPRLSS